MIFGLRLSFMCYNCLKNYYAQLLSLLELLPNLMQFGLCPKIEVSYHYAHAIQIFIVL
jgi:hypothetical protein